MTKPILVYCFCLCYVTIIISSRPIITVISHFMNLRIEKISSGRYTVGDEDDAVSNLYIGSLILGTRVFWYIQCNICDGSVEIVMKMCKIMCSYLGLLCTFASGTDNIAFGSIRTLIFLCRILTMYSIW